MTRSPSFGIVPVTVTESPVVRRMYSSWLACERSTLMGPVPVAYGATTIVCPAIHNTRPSMRTQIGLRGAGVDDQQEYAGGGDDRGSECVAECAPTHDRRETRPPSAAARAGGAMNSRPTVGPWSRIHRSASASTFLP
jgi:hypothetical protein